MNKSTHKQIGVMVVITRLAIGGAPQNVLTSIAGLDPARYRIVLVSGVPGAEEGSLIEEARRLNVSFHLVPSLVRAPHPVKDLKTLWSLWRLIKKEQVDIVHTHLSKAGVLGRFAAWLARVPAIVHTYHGDVLDGYFSRFKSGLYTYVERLVGRVTHRFVCVSNALRDRLATYRLGLPQDFVVISNGIDVDAFGATERLAGQRVGTLAMFYPVKRLDLFVHMAHRLRAKHPEISFDIAGGGIEEDTLHRLSQSLEQPVVFGGICNDKRAFFSDLKVFVSCSDYEGAGVGLMEAMAAGIPVVATRVGGVPEIVQEGVTGFLVAPGDVDALCEAVGKLLLDTSLCERMGLAAKEYAFRHFSHKKMISELEVLYQDLSKQNGAG